MHIHILGICGTFMRGLAVLAREAGHKVTGCDANVYPPMSTQLRAQGIELIEGFDPGQIDLQTDLYVVGNVVSRGNPLMEAIMDRGLPYVSGPQWIGEHILRDKWVLAVAGTHGKTTTSSMLAWILEDAGYHPGFLIGGVPMNFGISARIGGENGSESSFFVIEADEYDTAFFDKRSKFVHYRPRTAILNNLEYDHADIFPDLGAIETQFHHLVRSVPGNGRLVVNGREAALQRVLERGCWSEAERFDTPDGQTGWGMAEHDDGNFDVFFNGERAGTVQWSLTGAHNRWNAIAAIAAARHVGVTPQQAISSLSSFENVKRRMETRGIANGVTVIDDFAHHPTAIATTVAGLRRKAGTARILAVLEPRSNTMKLGTMKDALPASLAEADLVFGYGAKGGGKDALGWDLGAALAPLGDKARAFDDLPALVQAVAVAAQPGDSVLVMSNGGFGGVHQKLLDALAAKSQLRTVLYLHGFRSSPSSFKARRLQAHFQARGEVARFICPQLPPSPDEAFAQVRALVQGREEDSFAVVGSSLGGFYATALAEATGCRAVLINPAVWPARELAKYIGEQQAWHSEEKFYFRSEYIAELQALTVARVTRTERYLLLAATGDEVLDWREMTARYEGANQHVIEGSDHGLSDFDNYIDEVVRFCDA